jgi:hypothetical protein
MVFLLLAVLAALRFIEGADPLSALFFGVAAGCAALTRAVFLGALPVLILLMWWFRREEGWGSLRPALTGLLVALMILAPWTVRNGGIHGTLVPVSSGGGGSLLTGNNPYATGGWRLEPGFEEWFIHRAEERGIPNPTILREIDRNRLSSSIALDYMLENPGRVVLLAVRKSYIFWVYPIAHSDSNVPAQAIAVAGDILLLAGAALGAVALRRPSRGLWLVAGVVVAFWLIHAVMHAEARFRLPATPLLAVLWGFGAATTLSGEGRRALMADRKRMRLLAFFWAAIGAVYALTAWLFLQGKI